MSAPLFSIVIPTRNRAKLLRWSLQSAITQDFDDYEIVVVNNNCVDETDRVVAQFRTDRVRYFHTERTLAMPDNWEFAWEKAAGKYVLYLCDDDAYVPSTLSYLARNVLPANPAVVSFESCAYYHPDWIESERRNLLVIPMNDRGVVACDSRRLLVQLMRFEAPSWFPKLLNGCVERQTFEGIRKRIGRLFIPSCPDYSILMFALHLCPETWLVHRPLHLSGASLSSIGAMQRTMGNRAPSSQQFEREFEGNDFWGECPVKIPLVVNYIAETLIKAGRTLNTVGVESLPIDWDAYFRAAAAALLEIGHHAPEFVTEYQSELLRAALRHSRDCGVKTASLLRSQQPKINPVRRFIGKMIQTSQWLCRLELKLRFANDIRRSPRVFHLEPGVSAWINQLQVKGHKVGAANILDMSKRVNGYLDKYPKLDTRILDQN